MEPKLSECGKEYYEQLKEKYKGMEFVLVSKAKKMWQELMPTDFPILLRL